MMFSGVRGHLVTLFSASNYCGVSGNKAAFACLDPNLKVKIRQFRAKSLNDVNPAPSRADQLRAAVISQLTTRIAEHRIDLLWCTLQLLPCVSEV